MERKLHMNDLVSVIMPSYNTGKYIAESIRSVLNQTYQNWELIIVDDCSSDDTDKVVASFKDTRIQYLKNEQNCGAAFSRNRALRKAKGEWIAFLDSDDLWHPKKLECQLNFMKKHNIAFSYHNFEKIDEESNSLEIYVTGPKVVTKRKIYNYDYIGCLTFMYNTSVMGLIQVKDIKKNNDYAILLKLCKIANCYLLDKSLAKYRVRKESISHDKLIKKLKSHYDLFHICDEKSAPIALWYASWNMWYGILKKINFEKKNTIKKATVIGHFAFGEELLNGQTIKTKILTDELDKKFGKNKIRKIDTHGGKKLLLKVPFQVLSAFVHSENIIIFPAHNGVRVYVPLLAVGKKFFDTRRLHYVVIGGWLPEFIQHRKRLKNCLNKFDGIYVETSTMKRRMEQQGFQNIIVMPNCKDLNILNESDLVYHEAEPYKLCTFSRVMKEKGIEEAVNTVREVNESMGKVVYVLDIYGQIDEKQTEWFCELKDTFPQYIQYKGMVDYRESVETIKNYFALLFPTKYEGEGFAGTLIDALAAGVPVIASDWKYNSDIIIDGKTGKLYCADNRDMLVKILSYAYWNRREWEKQKLHCIQQAQDYLPQNVIKILLERLK